MIATLKRLAAEAAPSNPLVNPVLSGVAVTCVVGAAMDPALTQRVQYYPSHDVVARPQDLAVHGGRAVRGLGGRVAYFPSNTYYPTGGTLAAIFRTPDPVAQPEHYMNATSFEVEWLTDAPVMEIGYAPTVDRGMRVIVDGHYATAGMILPDKQASGAVRLEFAGIRKCRHIRFRGRGSIGFVGVNVGPGDMVAPASQTDVIRVSATGDSFSEGGRAFAAPVDPDGVFPQQLGYWLGWRDVRQTAVSMTGYVSTGSNGDVQTFGRMNLFDQIDWWGFTPDVIVCAGGYNDATYIRNRTRVTGGHYTDELCTPALVAAQAVRTWQKMRDVAPAAPIFVFGPWAGSRGPDEAIVSVERALSEAFAAWSDPRAWYIPVSVAPLSAESWIWGRGNDSAPRHDGNSDLYTSADGTHPNDLGGAYLGRRAAEAIRAILDAL